MRKAALPIVGALGGMIVPALLFVALNYGRPGQHGWGVPMATDIAFSLGVLGMVKGIPSELKIFLLTLAIADDIGAIMVIAFFYTDTLHVQALFVGLFILLVMFGVASHRRVADHRLCRCWALPSGSRFCGRESTPPSPASFWDSWCRRLHGFRSKNFRRSAST